LHQSVPLDAAEEARLDAKEQEFTARRAGIENRMKTANARLADAIRSDPRWSPEVEAITLEIESAAAELQRATLEHVFQMRDGLDPEHRATYDDALIGALNRGAK
ncbi:MAG: periplasmic heavy metal sensor, partial [Hyphomonadaceae bacterium]